MQDSDESLLKSFALDRDEKVFRTLSERYLGLIFHTALRRTGNRQLAEEVSQNILCAVAKKASALAKNPDILPAWLHRATLFESTSAMRSEIAQQRRKQLQTADDSAEPSSHWTDAIPHLDQALDKLPESDRSLLLLHYFENRPFPKIAQTLGKNPDAVKKQSQRALEKLSRILRSKGVTLSATVLATGLTSELAKAAPAAFLQSATTAVLSGSATYSTTGLTLMFATKSKAFIPLVVLLCAAPLAFQQIAISSVKRQNDALRSTLALADNSTPKITQRRNATAARAAGVSSNLDILVLVDEQAESRRTGGVRQIAFTEKLAALSPETLVRLIGEGAVLRIQQEKKTGILDALISTLADQDARLAVTTAIDAFPAGPELATLVSQTQVTRLFGEWADADPEGALAWFQEQEMSGKLNSSSASDRSGPIKDFKAPMIRALAANNNSEAVRIFKSASEPELLPLLSEVLMRRDLRGSCSASSMAIRLMPILREVFPEDRRWLEVIGSRLDRNFSGNLAEATLFLNQADLYADDREVVIRAVAETTLGTSRPHDPQLEARIDLELGAWLDTTAPQIADQVLEDARAKVAASRANQADYIIKNLRKAKDPTDRKLSEDLMNYDFRSRLQEALELAGKIKDPELRARTIEFLNTP